MPNDQQQQGVDVMFQLTGEQAMWAVLGLTYGIYCAWAKYCEHRWPRPDGE